MLCDDDYLDRFLEAEHRLELREHEALVAKLLKLNKAELSVLARHYGIKYLEEYTEARVWSHVCDRPCPVCGVPLSAADFLPCDHSQCPLERA